MEWLQSNWIWIVLGGGFIAFHIFGHGGHRHGHGGGGGRDPARANDVTDATETEHTHSDAGEPGAAGPNDPASSASPGDTNRAVSPTPADEKRHKHGC